MINGTVTHEIFVSRRGQLRILIFWHLGCSKIGRIYLRLTLNWQSNPKAYEEIERTSVRNAQPPLLCHDFKNSWQRQGQKKPPTTIRGVIPLFKAQDYWLLNAGCPCALTAVEDLGSAELSSMGVLSLPLLPVSFCQIIHLFSLLRWWDQIWRRKS